MEIKLYKYKSLVGDYWWRRVDDHRYLLCAGELARYVDIPPDATEAFVVFTKKKRKESWTLMWYAHTIGWLAEYRGGLNVYAQRAIKDALNAGYNYAHLEYEED